MQKPEGELRNGKQVLAAISANEPKGSNEAIEKIRLEQEIFLKLIKGEKA
jgi:hypothetical protein